MNSYSDASQFYSNSGIYNWDHVSSKFIESDFVDFFWRGFDKNQLILAFVQYMSMTNNVCASEIMHDYSINQRDL